MRDELKAGQIIGVMENGAAGDETGLPRGRYNLFVAYVDGQWRGYAESGGKIVSPAIRTSIVESPAEDYDPPQPRLLCKVAASVMRARSSNFDREIH